LRDFSEKASRLHGGKRVSTDQVRKSLGQYAARELARGDFSLKQHLAQEEKLFMIEALLRCSGNVQSAAGLAGIKRTTFLAKMQRHGLARI
jgi:transcriptional regulator of acetoin/glycerol metabolism